MRLVPVMFVVLVQVQIELVGRSGTLHFPMSCTAQQTIASCRVSLTMSCVVVREAVNDFRGNTFLSWYKAS